MKKDKDLNRDIDKKGKARNPDPITGAPGSHPLGTGAGAAIGGAAAGGAMAGIAAGPAGTVIGAAAGAVIGGLAGKGIAEKIDPTLEEAYWRENHPRQGWAKGRSYDEFRPAYRVGYEGYAQYGGAGTFEDREAELRRYYESNQPKLSWDEARPASRAAWQKLNRNTPPSTSVDSYGNPRAK